MITSLLFIALAYFVVMVVLTVFMVHAAYVRRKYLKKLYYEGFLER